MASIRSVLSEYSVFSGDRVRFLLNRFRERLWVKPLMVCLLSIAAAFIAKLAEGTGLAELVPVIAADSIEKLMSIMAASMLVIATFSVSSMVAAYASASGTATPRSFKLVIADDASQNALSTFVGAFIFSIVALTAVMNDYFETAGLFIVFVLTVIAFAVVIVTFIRWVDRIARLGRLGSTIEKVETATAGAMKRRCKEPTLRGARVSARTGGQAVFADSVGYVQQIDMAALQAWAKDAHARVEVAALPGAFAAPGRALAYIHGESEGAEDLDKSPVIQAFQVGSTRVFDDDPRFGVIVLSEIAGRALSPAVNDPGTAIGIIGTFLRLFVYWHEESLAKNSSEDSGADVDKRENVPEFDRVEVPEIPVRDMFDDAFMSIARDGASMVEVSVRLQKTLGSLALLGNTEMKEAAEYHKALALKRAGIALKIEEDLALVRNASM